MNTANEKYLNSVSDSKKEQILSQTAKHYGVSVPEITEELVDPEAENLFEYVAFNQSLALEIYKGFKRLKLIEEIEEVAGLPKMTSGAKSLHPSKWFDEL